MTDAASSTKQAGVEFHSVTVAAIEPLTSDAVAVSFEIPSEIAHVFEHIPGQHLILRATIDGEDVRRSYSICSAPGTTRPTVGIKHLPGGVFSTYVHERLKVGDAIEVTQPTGEFTLTPSRSNRNHYVAIGAGSGITPILSMIRSVLAFEPSSMFTLVYGNKDGGSVMFLDELDALKGQHPSRFVLLHVLSREFHEVELFEGRIDAQKLQRMLKTIIDPADVAGWYLCGPRGMVQSATEVLTANGVSVDDIHDELFYAGEVTEATVAQDDAEGATVRFTLRGRTSTVTVAMDGAPILDHVLAIRPDGPFSCRSGACASCRAQVTSGEVRMDKNWSLSKEEVSAGQILTCQSHPVSEVVELTYDV
ncbi:MAG: FAD-binding oxidoreductase [Acidimicrobiia bacterium]|nr:FAD-binding oxidoreductase [Acidimicrobiia bacterium]